ncbi:ferrochelatase [Brevibacterium sp. 5221]|uniref:Coproporphyrin III ferrochelatase n=1 Tax=Brevibacterium rongguiense TaxID=2695267 RepID=A0A6N9HAK8_9MICO|nr:ferrochelatase [Brevibacterium rongguiense]MYM20761.1 ferrochelatase [Brevibacterium rongguiense]
MSSVQPFDAVILMSFGGPEAPEEVLPFLQNVTRGRGIPDERLVEVGEHYYGFGGKSPINDQNRALLAELRAEFDRRGIDVPVLWGNRNWEPYLTDVVRAEHERSGARQFLAIDTSAYSSYSSCRQYREDFAKTIDALAAEGIEVGFDKIRQYFNHPGFAAAELDCVRTAARAFAAKTGGLDPERHRLLYVTHSIPDVMEDASEAQTAGYRAQHEALKDWVNEQLADEVPLRSELVYCSRSGPPSMPWLEPDVNDRMAELKEEGVEGVIAVPLGFVSDHMEVKYDLDTEAAETAAELGFAYERAATVGLKPQFVAGLVDLVEERAAQRRGEPVAPPAVTRLPALADGSGACSFECCRGVRERPTVPNWLPAPGA